MENPSNGNRRRFIQTMTLGAALFTRRPDTARRLVPLLEAGCVFVNDFVRSSPELPFGGIKQSGYGREGSRHGLEDYLELKYLCMGGIE